MSSKAKIGDPGRPAPHEAGAVGLPDQREARGALVKLAIGTLRYESRKVFDEVLRHPLRELAGMRVRYSYCCLTVLLRREGWHVNAKCIYRLFLLIFGVVDCVLVASVLTWACSEREFS